MARDQGLDGLPAEVIRQLAARVRPTRVPNVGFLQEMANLELLRRAIQESDRYADDLPPRDGP